MSRLRERMVWRVEGSSEEGLRRVVGRRGSQVQVVVEGEWRFMKWEAGWLISPLLM